MANTVQFDLVSPERRLASVEATEVRIPGADGDLTAMPGHAPTITTLRPGIMTVVAGGSEDDYVVIGGFAEITAKSVSVLAESALPRSEMTQETFDRMMEDARRELEKAKSDVQNEPGPVDDAVRLMADMVAVGSKIGLDPKQSNFG
ncbi:F0F1 ATP synthase subunit epsilon [Salipiger sp. IMCC34102]|uniref:F0F1 ATP synthase subunit epsilon n=1 Tax=Salipiger sp. IMCC34102 TaxID=2510647 RepID=UPI00101B63C1|nr:F0F1 ATP synthase subunit epsilon [Salipiger sp. IMCC34102]RYH03813.1 F0F1 ATP synthase subunit epsilon [Salipiger sp. IMCC34102]